MSTVDIASPFRQLQSNLKSKMSVAVLTGGGDRPYAYGLTTALIAQGFALDIIGGDQLDAPEFHSTPGVMYLNLRGDQRRDANVATKVCRVIMYYIRLLTYAWTAEPRIFHILWNNKFEVFDRTLLMLYYKSLRKKLVLTVHNVNAGNRDSCDTALNRVTLRTQYRLADHLFVHTDRMKRQLIDEFGVNESAISVIPFGVNNSVPNTALTSQAAKRRLGLRPDDRSILFFGNIAPYKGVEYVVAAFEELSARATNYRLVLAGRPRKGCEPYWQEIRRQIDRSRIGDRILKNIDRIPDEDIEVYFKAADVLILPYTKISQSGVLFLAYGFGLPVVATDVGSLKEEILEGRTGFVCRAEDSGDLARAIETYFASDLFRYLDHSRQQIREYVAKTHSWETVGVVSGTVYSGLSPTTRETVSI